MSEIATVNPNKSTGAQLRNSMLQAHIDTINLHAARGNAPQPMRSYGINCNDDGVRASYGVDNQTFHVDISWSFIEKAKEIFK